MTLRLVFLLLPLMAWADLPQASVTPPPGRYSSAVTFSVTVPEGTSVLYRFLESSDARSLPWTNPLTLDALPGETRSYTVRLTTQLPSGEAVVRDFAYTVARQASRYPTVKPIPGTYPTRLELKTSLPDGWTLTQDGGTVTETPVLDAPDGSRRTYVFVAKGPGQSAVWSYDIDKRDQDASLDVVSPVPGNWANAQQLAVTFRGLDRVVWAYGDHAGADSPEYSGVVTLDTGKRTVTVAGRTRTGRWIQKSVSWTSGQAELPTNWPLPGVRTEGADFPEADGWTFSWDEGRSWQPASRHEDAPTASRKIVVAEARKADSVSRYVYWFDARPPQVPELRFEGGWNPRVLFSGSPEALHRVTWTATDGTKKEDAALWGPLGAWKVPDNVIGARVEVKAANGAAAEALLSFAETGWSVPRWESWDKSGPKLPVGGRVVPRPGFLAAYEVSSSPNVGEPSTDSPWLDGAFLPAVPWGADRTFYVRFAWRDPSGLTGPASPVYAVRVDRLPPPLPSVRETGGQIVASADEADLFWAATPDRVASADALTFQPYTGPVDRSSLGGSGLWFHVRAQDAAGNLGPARLNVALAGTPTGVVQVDADASVGETPVTDGGVYPWPEFHLRTETTGLWVGAADARTGVPPTWAAELQPWNGIFSRSAQGTRRSFLVYWNVKTADGWAWPSPKTLTITLDRGPPAAPVMSAWPAAALAQPWTLVMKPGQTGDTLRYSFTLDGSPPADPVISGQPWTGTRTWEASEGALTQLRLRVAAVSISGQSTEIPLKPVQFDRRSAPLVSVPLEPFTYRNSPYIVPGTGGTVRYTLTTDGTTPGVPGLDSPLVAEGLSLEGKGGQTVLYRFRWRAYSAAGEPGPTSDTYSVLIDQTQSTPSAGRDYSDTVPLVSGLPPSGVSAAPVTLTASWDGVLRYELQEGAGSPPPVTAGSPAWEQKMVLGADGVDRTYALNVRGFSVGGQPLTPEARYVVRVDQSAPEAPVFDVATDQKASAALSSAPPRDEVLEYRWIWQSYPQGSGDSGWETDFPAIFAAPDGEMTRVTVQARLRDEAGNLGPVAEKAVFLDQNVVYVAPGSAGDGSRATPAAEIGAAIELARRSGRSIVFVASGNYSIDRTLDLGGLHLYGGWSKNQWESARDGHTVWTQTARFNGASLIQTTEKDWVLAGVDLFAAKGLSQVVSVKAGSVAVSDSIWTWGGAGLGWKQAGGSLTATRVSVVYNAQPRGAFLSLDSASATLNSLNLSADGNQEGMLFSSKESRVLVNDLTVVSKNGTGYDGLWQSDGGSLTVNGARVLIGDGAGRALAFRLKNAEASLNRLDLSLLATASNTAFQLTGGTLNVGQASVSLLRGTEFNQGVVADHAKTTLSEFSLKIETGTYQGGFNLDGGSLTLSSGTVSIKGGGQQAWGGRFRGNSLVNFDGITWTLAQKTPGQTFMLDAPWADGSVNNSVTGW